MELTKCFCLFIELMVVINSSYSYMPRRTYTRNRVPSSSSIIRQCETPLLKNGSVRLRQRGRLIRYLCLPSYILIGDKYASCVQGQWENPVPMCIKPGCPNVVPPENGFTVVDKNGALTILFCRPGYSVAGSHETFCNGTVWDRSLGSCRETQASTVLSCDFEVSTICDWEADPSHDFEWVRKNGYTSLKQLQTGPSHDNTIGVPLEGHFMLATFASQSPHAVARLISPLYPAEASKEACFRFYYHMYGALTGVLRVYIKPESVSIQEMLDSAKYLFMEKNGSLENAWLESVFDIDQYDQDFQIVIEATSIRTTRSNIAIDDVALLKGADCMNEESKSTAVTEEEDGIFDAQSCFNRCQETEPQSRYVTETTITSTNKTVNILQCDCYDGCVDKKSCCLDYRSICVFDASTMDTISSEPITELALSTNAALKPTSLLLPTITTPTTTSSTTVRSTITTVPTTTVTPRTKATLTVKTIPTTKAIITIKTTIPTMKTTTPTMKTTTPTMKTSIPTMKTSSTPKIIPTTKTTMATTKTIPKIVTTSSTPTPTTVKLTTAPTKTSSTTMATTNKSTPRRSVYPLPTTNRTTIVLGTKSTTTIVPITFTVKYTANISATTKSISKLRNDVNVLTDTDPFPTNLLHVFGIVLMIAVILVISVVSFRFYRKYQSDRYNYKSNSKRYFKDASDEVRFLTADEQLDFTMQGEDNNCR